MIRPRTDIDALSGHVPLSQASLSAEELFNQVVDRLLAGESLDMLAFLAAHPEHADRLRHLWPTALALASMAASVAGGSAGPATDAPPAIQLSDFRLLREIGRGGMGVVYAAEQISLKRTVALKVLPAAASLDPKRLRRFMNEAQAAANLHHTHIVPVHAVGMEHGVHYYAMQCIEGRSLAEVLDELRGPSEAAASGLPPSCTTTSGLPPFGTPAYFRRLAELGIQAAEALAHAHSLSVLHRDIKPGNLLLDAQGRLWVTDFGLASCQSDERLTSIGDTVGTLRYMSPEQAGGGGVVDHRSDVYSLGLTLYELACLQPAFDRQSRAAILEQVLRAEPDPPGLHCHNIPRELETIIVKAIAKEPAARYATAQDLADDLRRFVEDRPILARRPTGRERAAKWLRRHPAVLRSLVASTALVGLVLAVSVLLVASAYRSEQFEHGRAEREKTAAIAAQQSAQRSADLAQARLELSQRAVYNLQLQRVGASWRENPSQAIALLEDEAACPPALRDFTWGYYRKLCEMDRRVLRGHEGPVFSVAWSPDGRLVASGGKDNTVRLWDPATGREVAKLTGHTHWVTGVAFSPDSKTLASSSRDKTVRLWDVETRQTRKVLKRHADIVECVTFSHDGRMVAAGGMDRLIVIWDTQTGEQRALFEGREDGVTCMKFLADDQWLVAGNRVGEIATFSLSRGGEIEEITAGYDAMPICSMDLSSDETSLAFVTWNRTIETWDLKTRRRVQLISDAGASLGHRSRIRGVAYSPHGELIATCGDDGFLLLWDATTGQQKMVLEGHSGFVRSVAWASDGSHLASASNDGTVVLWNVSFESASATLDGHPASVHGAAISPDCSLLASCGDQAKVFLWDMATHTQLASLDGHTDLVKFVAFSSDGSLLASASYDRTIKLWDVKSRVCLATLGTPKNPSATGSASAGSDVTLAEPVPPGSLPADGHTDRVESLVFTRDGGLLVSASRDSTIKVWDVRTHKLVTTLHGHADKVRSVDISPDGTKLLSGGRDRTIRVWDLATGRELHVIEDDAPIGAVAFSPDGKTFLSTTLRTSPIGAFAGKIRIWDAKTNKLLATMNGHTDEVLSACFSPDGRTIASAGQDNTIRLWDPCTGTERATLPGHAGWVYFVQFSLDNRLLASASSDSTVKLWTTRALNDAPYQRPANGETKDLVSHDLRHVIRTLRGHSDGIRCLTFSEGNPPLLASASLDGTIRIWDFQAGMELATLRGHQYRADDLAFSRDGTVLISHDELGTCIKLWNVDSATERSSLAGHYFAVAFSPQTDRFAAASMSENLWRLFDFHSGSAIATVPASRFAGGCLAPDGHGLVVTDFRSTQMTALDFVPNNRDVLFGNFYGSKWQSSLRFSSDGRLLASNTTELDEPIILWNGQTFERLQTIGAGLDPIDSFSFAIDGKLLVTSGENHGVRLWDTATGKQVLQLVLPAEAMGVAAFSSDGRILATGGADHRIRLWDLPALLRDARNASP